MGSAVKHVATLFIGALALGTPASAEPPCDFKGLSVGDTKTPVEIMAVLGVAKYRMNPPESPFDEKLAAARKYGIIPAGELRDWKIGPHCTQIFCKVPYGIGIGNNNTPVSVYVSFPSGTITEIDVSFSETSWDELRPILDQKYGADWDIERTELLVTDVSTKKSTMRDRVLLTRVTNGSNRATGDRCQIWATNIDIIHQHHDPLGPYHSLFVIKLVSKNF